MNIREISALEKEYGREAVLYSVRYALDEIKRMGQTDEVADIEKRVQYLSKGKIQSIFHSGLKEVINATGIIIHTNLGRAPLGEDIVREISKAISGYCDLEFDLDKGRRGNRTKCVEETLKYLTGADGVAVVNNNAAGLMLTLSVFAKRKEVVVSRGELVEIGGSFRIPEILKASGAKMVEVGTTNRTRLSDYEKAINSKTAMILKVHKSNYVIKGFTEEAPLEKIVELARKFDLRVLYDLGSGCADSQINDVFSKEPDIKRAVASGADFVAFSADKLFGGPQAGVVCGDKEEIAKLKKAPMMRALRVGKMTLSALGTVAVRHAEKSGNFTDIPVVEMSSTKSGELLEKAEKLSGLMQKKGVDSRVEKSRGKAGGGSLTDTEIESYCVAIRLEGKKRKENLERMFFSLMRNSKPIVSVLRKGELVFDVLTLKERDFEYIADSISEVYFKSENTRKS
ncbi:L-seryl-tRNA(Sec) selenium transferase [candidate division WOR-3 bacterium]|nr:L-seryl-tRNA(Sec) selenium transferase [candidate division WOR-3 bacterium]